MTKVFEAGPKSGPYDGYVYKVADQCLHPIPHRVDPGDLVINFSGLYIIGECEPEDEIVWAHRLFLNRQRTHESARRALQANPEGEC